MRPILFALALAAFFFSFPVPSDPLSSFFSSVGSRSMNKEGCGADPNGLSAPATQAIPLDEGCGMDPYGRCAATAGSVLSTEAGCGMDPYGCP